LWGVIIGSYSTIYVAAPLEWYLSARGRAAHLAAGSSEPPTVPNKSG
jgi:preprotein translocase subunit SecF